MYTEEQLKRKTRLLDSEFINEIAGKYVNDEDDEEEDFDDEYDDWLAESCISSEINQIGQGRPRKHLGFCSRKQVEEEFELFEEAQKEVSKHGLLPSIMDSKLWKVKCKIGFERQLVI